MAYPTEIPGGELTLPEKEYMTRFFIRRKTNSQIKEETLEEIPWSRAKLELTIEHYDHQLARNLEIMSANEYLYARVSNEIKAREQNQKHTGLRKMSQHDLLFLYNYSRVVLVQNYSVEGRVTMYRDAFVAELPNIAGTQLKPINRANIYLTVAEPLEKVYRAYDSELEKLASQGIDVDALLKKTEEGVIAVVDNKGRISWVRP